MKVCLVHNYYAEPGGEDAVFEAEVTALEHEGIEVTTASTANKKFRGSAAMRVAAGSIWSRSFAKKFDLVLKSEQPTVCHFHNIFPLISPAAYYACRQRDIPVVQTLHNYRLMCPAATFFRDGAHCIECRGVSAPFAAVRHGCYRSSRMASAAVTGMLAVHNLAGTWRRAVDVYLTPSECARDHFIAAGFPRDRVRAKPNFLSEDPGVGDHGGGFALFVGRLSSEKGLATLLDAWREIGVEIPLKIVGDGPLASLRKSELPGIAWLGRRSRDEVCALMKEAAVLVVPSECHETFGMIIVEAFATGLPVVTTGIGAQAELVEEARSGLHFNPGDARGLGDAVVRLIRDREAAAAMGRAGRLAYEAKYTRRVHLETILDLYREVAGTSAKRTATVA